MTIFIAHHGTSLDAAENIIASKKFYIVESDERHLGNGAYFFMSGIGNSIAEAKNYALRAAFDKKEQKYRYEKYGVVEASITVDDDRILDLNSHEGLAMFDLVRKEIFEKKKRANEKMTKIEDGFIINLLEKKNVIPMDVVITQRNIRLDPSEIELNLRSLVPNCIVCCVKKDSCVTPIGIVDKGDVA